MDLKSALFLSLKEIKERQGRVESELVDLNYPEQAKFVRDGAMFVAACTTRRAGKSSGLAYKFFRKAKKYQGSDLMMPYVSLTRDSARNIMWPVLQEISHKEGINADFKESSLTVKAFGCEIKLFGADQKNFIDRLRGIKYPLGAIDEAQGFRSHIEELVDEVMSASISDFDEDGQLVLTGTPGPVPKGFFYDVTQGKGGFSIHKWSAFQNPYIKAKKFVEELMKKKGWDWTHPTIRREWLGEWVADLDSLCYKFDDKLNRAQLPSHKDYTYVIGVDLGYDPDPTAFIVTAYNEYDPHLYILEEYQETKLIISDVSERIKYYLKKYPNAYIVMDAADKQAVEEMKQRYGLPITPAEKHGKAGFIELMNSDMKRGIIKVVNAEGLIDDWMNLIWDSESDKRIEDKRYPNHRPDAALYAWRYCYNFLWKDRPAAVPLHSEEKVDEFWDREAQKILDQRREEDEYNFGA